MNLNLSKTGYELIKHYEGLHDGDLSQIGLQPKMCPAGIWTGGWGRALRDEKGRFLKGEKDKKKAYEICGDLTLEEANQWLFEDTAIFEKQVNNLNLKLSQYQFEPLVSFSYNEGFANLLSSTLLKRIIKNDTADRIYNAFLMWNKARIDGVLKILPGLTARRKSEAELFNNHVLIYYN
ncbi:MAG: lysozyme [Atribacterota bacterium]|nr:lysozyme [Atribacterota bacterium]